jgi:hypothetical protein
VAAWKIYTFMHYPVIHQITLANTLQKLKKGEEETACCQKAKVAGNELFRRCSLDYPKHQQWYYFTSEF